MNSCVSEWVIESEAVEPPAGNQREINWKRAHEELLRLACTRAGLDWEEGHWLVRAVQSGAYLRFGYGSFAEYVERLFGYTPRWTAEKLRVAEALEELPEMTQALRDGVVSWSAVRELTRVATPVTEPEWLHVSRSRTVREIEGLVSGQRRGNRPDDPPDPMKRRHALRFEVTAETYAVFREAQGKVRRDAGGPIDDDSTLLSIARQILGGPTDEGRSSYQVIVNVCDRCKRAVQQAHGELVEVGAEVAEMVACDAQYVDINDTHVGPSESTDVGPSESTDVGPSESTHVGPSESTDVGPTELTDVGPTELTHAGPTELTHAGPTELTPAGSKHAAPRATQSIPPAIRRLVMRRNHGRCVVPGCRHASFLDVHHIDLRSEGGRHDPDRLIVLCGAHHRAQHRAFLSIEGSVSAGLRFRHADGTDYGGVPSPMRVDARAKAFGALRNLGFRETEVKQALERISTHVGADATIETFVRQALLVLTNAGVKSR